RRLDDAPLADLVHVQSDEQRDGDGAGDGEGAPGRAGDDLHAVGGEGDGAAGGGEGGSVFGGVDLERLGGLAGGAGGGVPDGAAFGEGVERAPGGIQLGAGGEGDLHALGELDLLPAQRLDDHEAEPRQGDDHDEQDGGGDNAVGPGAQLAPGDLGEGL